MTNELVEAIKTIRGELVKKGDLYDGFVASIESALKEAKPYTKEHILALDILNRIVGI